MGLNYTTNENANEFGIVALTNGVFETIASITIGENDAVKLADATPFAKPITCKIKDNLINISCDIKIKRGVKVNETVEKIQEKVYNTIYQMTDLKVDKIDVRVIGFLF